MQSRADNQENQNEGQVSDTTIASFKIFHFLIETRKAAGFKSLQVNCWEIDQVALKYQIVFFDKTCKKKVEQRKSKHHHQILHIRISVGSKLQVFPNKNRKDEQHYFLEFSSDLLLLNFFFSWYL